MNKSLTNQETRIMPVYDITNCGPRSRYMANGKLVHNSDKINVQNLGKRTKEPVLRQAMRAKDGYIVVGTDSSQIEARLLNFLANQTDVVDIFRQKKDVYLYMASSIYNESYEDLYAQSKGPNATKEGKTKRNLGKTTELGAGYGASAEKFANLMEQSGLSDMVAMAEQSIMAYRNSHKQVVNFWQTCQTALKVMHGGGSMWFGGPNNDLLFADGNSTFHGVRIPSIRFPNGTYLFYQNLREEIFEGRTNLVYDQFKGRGFESTRIWGSKCAENVTQKLAFDILKWQAIEIAKRGVSINLNVHDEWVSIVPKELGAYAVKTHYECMKAVPEYIPQGLLDCEVDFGLSYGDTKTIDVGSVL